MVKRVEAGRSERAGGQEGPLSSLSIISGSSRYLLRGSCTSGGFFDRHLAERAAREETLAAAVA